MPLAKEVCEKRTPHPAAPQQATADQEPREPTPAALILLALDVFVLVFRFASFADEVCEKRTPHPAAPQ